MNNHKGINHSVIFLILIIILSVFNLGLNNLSTNMSIRDQLAEDSLNLTNESLGNNTFIDFELIIDRTGWFSENNRLFITVNSGIDWTDITPPNFDGFTIENICFIDQSKGVVLASYISGAEYNFILFTTQDGGINWVQTLISTSSGLVIYEAIDSTFMQWIDNSKGWILIKKPTSINFSEGDFYITTDGGYSWVKVDSPIGDNFIFLDEEIGYIAGGPDGNRLQRTNDGGFTWTDIAVQFYPWDDNLIFSLPVLMKDGTQVIAALSTGAISPEQVLIFNSTDIGSSWTLLDQYLFTDSHDGSSTIQISSAAPDNLQIVLEDYSTIVNYSPAGFSVINIVNEEYTLQSASFSSFNEGWGLFVNNNCQTMEGEDTDTIECLKSSRFYDTSTGGKSWNQIPFPSGLLEINTSSEFITQSSANNNLNRSYDNTEIFIGQGFDKCEIPTLSQMQTWFSSSPYKTVNLYIGGISRACPNSALSQSYVESLYYQGWKFFPTWVGPQAPCSTFNHPMSSDPTTAYQQGVDNANQAAATLANLGFTNPDGSGSVVYYDIENYSGDTTCYTAVNSFMNGWTYQLHQLGIQSGIYGSSCASHLTNYFSLANPPDVIWPAAWYHSGGDGYYNSSATVWSVPCISDSVYNNHERIRQYEGGHYETWGGKELLIDSNVLDGVVAIPMTSDNTPPTNPTTINPGCVATNGSWQNTCNEPNFSWSGATDDDSGVAGYQYYWGTSSSGTDTRFRSDNTFSPGVVSEGTYYLRLRTMDNEDNFAPWKTMYVFKFDATPPEGFLTINDGALLTYRTMVRLHSLVSDNLSGAHLIRYRDQGGAWEDWQGIQDESWILPAYTDQTYFVEAEVIDAAGNISTMFGNAIYLDIYPDQPSSTYYTIQKSTFGMSATNGSSTSYKLTGTLSQPSTIGTSSSENYLLNSGFWTWLLDFIEETELFFFIPAFMN